MNKSLSSIVYFKFEHNGEIYDYVDILGKCTKEQLEDSLGTESKVDFQVIENALNNESAVKKWSMNTTKTIKELFNKGIYTYFPAYRFEQPAYLNDPYMVNLNFKKEMEFEGYLMNPIEVTSDLDNITNWIMDIVLDSELYGGQNSVTLTQINKVFSELLMAKVGKPTRIGIGPRNLGAARIQVIRQEDLQQIYPTVYGMSSGELSQMCMFVELIKQADRLGYGCSNITEIVLVDEIEKHLHMIMQKETLPKLLKLFPGIQFIVSSHSPFFNMGLEDCLPSQYKLFDMGNRGMECLPDQNELFREVYDTMVEVNNRYAERYRNLSKQVSENSRPLIITEGKTDWKHIKSAIKALKIDDFPGEFYECGNSRDGKFQTKFSGIAHKVANNGIIDEKVFRADDLAQANSVALSKGKFTELIYKEEQFAQEFDFSAFKELIQILKDLCANKKN